MALYTVRPNGDVSTNFVTLGGAATAWEATSDESDSTYCLFYTGGTVTVPAWIHILLGTVSIPADERIKRVRPRVRYSTGVGSTTMHVWLEDDYNHVSNHDYWTAAVGSSTTIEGAWRSTAPDGSAWTQAAIDSLHVVIRDDDVGTTKPIVRAVYVDIETTKTPVVNVTAPAGTITDISTPTITATYADDDGDPMDRVWCKVFSAAQYAEWDFDPMTIMPTWENASTDGLPATGSSHSVVVSTPLPNGTYRAYVKARNNALIGGHWSDWDYSEFTVAIPPPNSPTITTVADNSTASITASIHPRDNVLWAHDSDFEVSSPSSWDGAMNCTFSRLESALATSGGWVGVMTSDASGQMIAHTDPSMPNLVIPGEIYHGTVKVRAATNNRTVMARVYWHTTSALATPNYSDLGSPTVDQTAAWTTFAADVTASPDARFGSLWISVADTVAGEKHYIDQAGIMLGSGTPWARGYNQGTTSFEIQRMYADDSTEDFTRDYPLDYPRAITHTFTYVDHEAPRLVPIRYRARTKWVDQITGNALISPWSSPTTAVTLASDDWWLKSTTDPTKNINLTVAWDTFQEDEPIDEGEFDALDADSTVVVYGRTRGARLSFDALFTTQAQWDSFNALRRRKETLLLQDSNGRSWYVRLLGKRPAKERRFAVGVIERRLTINAVEVDI